MKVELVRPCAYLDISKGDQRLGRIVFELYDDLAPKALENFLSLCKGFDNLSYKNNYFHRVIKNFMIQAGDLSNGLYDSEEYPHENIGKGGRSIYNDSTFEDENLSETLNEPFKLCMANSGPNTNKSQFFITTYPQSHLDGKHTVFGKVIHGKSIIREIESVDTNGNNVPIMSERILIENCGEWIQGDPLPNSNASYDQIGGDIFEEYPDDDLNIDKESSESVYNASTKIKESGGLLFKNGEKQQAFFKYKKCLRYVMEYFPDPDQEPDWFNKYLDLKKKLYLNLSIVCLQLKNFKKCIDYCSYLIEMDGKLINSQDLAKAYYRKGSAQTELKQYKESLQNLLKAQKLLPNDNVISRDVTKCEQLIDQQKKNEKAKYSKFFS